MSKRYLSVDSGKSDTKTCVMVNSDCTIVNTSFPTRVKEKGINDCLETIGGLGNTGFIVEYDGKNYTVGSIVNTDDGFTNNRNSKNDLIHKIATLTAIANSVNTGDEVYVAIGCPIELYQNKENRELYLESILPSGRIDLTVNGTHKHFMIVKKTVLPESTGIFLSHPRYFMEKIVGIIDIGGLNLNGALVNNTNLVPESCFTEKLGRRSIDKIVKDYAEREYDTSFSMSEINHYIRQGYIKDNLDHEKEETSRLFISNTLRDHFVKIINACLNHGWNLRNMDLVFTGGSSVLHERLIRKIYPSALIADDTVFSNAEGFLIHLCASEHIKVNRIRRD